MRESPGLLPDGWSSVAAIASYQRHQQPRNVVLYCWRTAPRLAWALGH